MRNPSQFHSTPCQRHFDPDCACEETDKMNGTTKVLILISVVLCFLANKACSCAASSQKEQNADNTNDACSSDSGCHSYNQPGSYSAEPGRDYNVFIGSFHVHFYEGQASEKTTSGSSSSKEEAQQQGTDAEYEDRMDKVLGKLEEMSDALLKLKTVFKGL